MKTTQVTTLTGCRAVRQGYGRDAFHRFPISMCKVRDAVKGIPTTFAAAILLCAGVLTAQAAEISLETAPPVVVRTAPPAGAIDVDPALTELRVTFSKPMMDRSWSWSTWGEENFPEVAGDIRYEADQRTCVLPVKLEPGKFYATWLNSDKFGNFKDRNGRPAVPYLLTFTTRSTGGVGTGADLAFRAPVEAILPSPAGARAELLDLDTGLRATSEAFGRNDRETHAWIRANQLDVLGVVEKGQIAVLCMDMVAVPAESNSWDRITAQTVTTNWNLSQGEAKTVMGISPVTDKTDVWLIRTREGGQGVLQILGPTADNDGVRVRYRLQTSSTANQLPSAEGKPNRNYEYVVRPGDTLSAIVQAYRSQGIQTTVDEILKANPGLDPQRLKAGQEILVPVGPNSSATEATTVPARGFVRVVVDAQRMTFEGEDGSWETLDGLLNSVPDREHTVLEWAVPTTQITLQQQNEWTARFRKLAMNHDFEYSSYVGVHPFGSKGGMAPVAQVESRAAVSEDDLQLLLNDDQKAVIAWTDRQFRSFFDNRTFKGWSDEETKTLEAKCIDALNGPRSSDYYKAINTLGALRSTNALPRLREIAFERVDRNNRDRWMAVRVLGIIGDRQSVPDLIHLVYHGNQNTHWWAQIALVQLTGQNFGGDWEAWGHWWNESGGEPAYNGEIIRWWNGQAKTVEELKQVLAEGDEKFIKDVRPR